MERPAGSITGKGTCTRYIRVLHSIRIHSLLYTKQLDSVLYTTQYIIKHTMQTTYYTQHIQCIIQITVFYTQQYIQHSILYITQNITNISYAIQYVIDSTIYTAYSKNVYMIQNKVYIVCYRLHTIYSVLYDTQHVICSVLYAIQYVPHIYSINCILYIVGLYATQFIIHYTMYYTIHSIYSILVQTLGMSVVYIVCLEYM